MYMTDLDTEDQVLICARSTFPKKESDEYMINAEETAESILEVPEEIPPDVRRNVVAIVTSGAYEYDRYKNRYMDDIKELCSFKPPHLVFDTTHLLAKFAKENNLFCTVEVVMKTSLRKESYVEQLTNIR
ncbi:uncharacterized protein LOC124460283 [Drosophila willistoni]|uniref:uncharacterized protein LOC124460283 n=1 Tax=Drosophila willistoni TaxID=7260 RepID=UPI001F079579|nr:uncharacterized protein LOC124460283 [Drosophila willistoni]